MPDEMIWNDWGSASDRRGRDVTVSVVVYGLGA